MSICFNTVNVKCGPNRVAAYRDEDDNLTIYIGDYVDDAPGSSIFNEITEGYTTFTIKEDTGD